MLATTVLAFVSASYAFYTVVSPKTTTALQATLDTGTMIVSTLAGLVWSLVIFNIDRRAAQRQAMCLYGRARPARSGKTLSADVQ